MNDIRKYFHKVGGEEISGVTVTSCVNLINIEFDSIVQINATFPLAGILLPVLSP